MHRSTYVLAAAIGAAALGACADKNPTAPPTSSEIAPPAVTSERAQFAAALADAKTRLVAGLADRAASAVLAASLRSLERAFASDDARQLDVRSAAARSALVAYEARAAASDAPDLEAIRLVIDRLDALRQTTIAPTP